MSKPREPKQELEPIQPGLLYPIEVFYRATGLGRSAVRIARESGLNIRYTAGRAWILGSDWIEYVTNTGKTSKDGAATVDILSGSAYKDGRSRTPER